KSILRLLPVFLERSIVLYQLCVYQFLDLCYVHRFSLLVGRPAERYLQFLTGGCYLRPCQPSHYQDCHQRGGNRQYSSQIGGRKVEPSAVVYHQWWGNNFFVTHHGQQVSCVPQLLHFEPCLGRFCQVALHFFFLHSLQLTIQVGHQGSFIWSIVHN